MKRILLYLLLTVGILPAAAQKNAAFLAYIENHKAMAIEQMKRYHVPASITLAQGILESAAGTSYLAIAANNHFGIKTGSTWTGPWVTKDDDKNQEKFRKYGSVAESYEDHSRFLQKQRYASLFDLDPADYKGWAYGLKAAGYATNPQYPTRLINLIETYDLAQYDHVQTTSAVTLNDIPVAYDNGIITYVTETRYKTTNYTPEGNYRTVTHTPAICNDVAYIRARKGDTYESLAYEFGTTSGKLRKYNEVYAYAQPSAGDIVFLHPKQNHVAPNLRGAFHKVAAGESLHTISQCYGIKMGRLYRWNRLPASFRTSVGDLLRLN